MENNTYPMKWYKFLIKVDLPVSFILNLMRALDIITGSQYEGKAERVYSAYPSMRFLDWAVIAGAIGLAVFIFYIRKWLADYSEKGPKNFLILQFLGPAFNVLYLLIGSAILEEDIDTLSIIVDIVVCVVMFALNKIYFDRRKELFVYY